MDLCIPYNQVKISLNYFKKNNEIKKKIENYENPKKKKK